MTGTRDELVALLTAWGWSITPHEDDPAYDLWTRDGERAAMGIIVPNDPQRPDYERYMRRAWNALGIDEGPRLLAVVREVAKVAVPVGVTPSDDSWWKGYEEAMRRVRVQLAPLAETTEETE